MTTPRRQQIIENLKDKESRDFFVEQYISTSIPFQIRAIRETLCKTQKKLAEEMGTGQPVISQLENPDYGNFTLNTLKKLASIFDVALIVKFASFSELVDTFENLSPDRISVPTYSNDRRLHDRRITISQVAVPQWFQFHTTNATNVRLVSNHTRNTLVETLPHGTETFH